MAIAKLSTNFACRPFNIDVEITDGILNFGVSQLDFDRSDVADGAVDHGSFRAPK